MAPALPRTHTHTHTHTHTCNCAVQFATLDPATHAYSFWEGVPTSGKRAFGELFAKSKTLRVSRRKSGWGQGRECV